MGKSGHLSSPGNVEGKLCVNCNVLVRTKRTKIIPRDTFHQLNPQIAIAGGGEGGGALPRTPLGSLQRSRDILAGFKESAWQQNRKGRVDRAVGKGRVGKRRGGEEWRDRGKDVEEREDVDFAPSCKNSFGRP